MSAAGMQAAFSILEKPHAAGQEKKEKSAGAAGGTKMAQEANEGQPWLQLMCRDRQTAGDMGNNLIFQHRS